MPPVPRERASEGNLTNWILEILGRPRNSREEASNLNKLGFFATCQGGYDLTEPGIFFRTSRTLECLEQTHRNDPTNKWGGAARKFEVAPSKKLQV